MPDKAAAHLELGTSRKNTEQYVCLCDADRLVALFSCLDQFV